MYHRDASPQLLDRRPHPGKANHVAVALDRLAWPEVIGTIAGDDTIFLAVKDSVTQRRVLREVRKLARL